MSSDGGVLLLRQAERRFGQLSEVAGTLDDPRRQASCDHKLVDLLRQRVFGLALGYEDLNDHDALRHDLAWQTAVERARKPASSPTLCRLENGADRQAAWRITGSGGTCRPGVTSTSEPMASTSRRGWIRTSNACA